MKQAVKAFINRHDLLKKGDHVVLAVSGGPDSMALTGFFMEIAPEWDLELTVTHVEHGLRERESVEDGLFVEAFCKEKGIPFFLHEADVKRRKQADKTGTQEAARACRYEWFSELMHKLGADKLALAHHGDDQIETMMMRQIRGAVSGRKGIPVKRPFACGELIRPFLDVEKDDLTDYCRENSIPFRHDASNEDSLYQRNRIRKELLTFIKKENPKAHSVFQWQSEMWAEEDDWLQQEASRFAKEVITAQKTDKVTVSVPRFLKVPRALQRRVIHLILNYLSENGDYPLTRSHTDAVNKVLASRYPSARIKLADGMVAVKNYDELTFIRNGNSVFDPVDDFPPESLNVPGEAVVPAARITAAVVQAGEAAKTEEGCALFDMDKISLPLIIRPRADGDKMSYLGGSGTKKLKDIFIDAKVSKRDRDLWPIVTDSHGTILWVPYIKRSNEALTDENTSRVAQLTCRIFT